MVHTRGQGARPEGFSEYQPSKRERKPKDDPPLESPKRVFPRATLALALFAPPSRNASSRTRDQMRDASSQTRVVMKDASTQTDIDLTSVAEVPSAKRRREGEETDDNASKRRKAVTPDQPKFLFSKTRNRSLLTSAPPKFGARRESPFFTRVIEPTSPDTTPEHEAGLPRSRERERPPQTPTPAPTSVGIFGSVRKIFGYFTGSQGAVQNGAQREQEQQQLRQSPNESHTATDTGEDQDALEPGSPTPVPHPSEPDSPGADPNILDSKIYNREFFKRRRIANTIAGRDQLSTMRKDAEEASTGFDPVDTPGTNKRKLASVDGSIPGPRRGGFGIDDNYLDVDSEVEGLEDSQSGEAQPSTPSTKPVPQTPLRSAMRQPGIGLGSIGRSGKSVQINPISSVKPIYGQYGRSGEYRGSTFSDLSSPSESSLSVADISDMHSPATARNTLQNESPKFRLDHTVVDPNDETWRPSLANPRPGHFRVPDDDEFEDEDEGDETITSAHTTGPYEVPPQPSTPRMAHAELPQQSPLSGISSFTGHTDSIMLNDTQEIRLNKARSEAQKYKPARSSRLSLTEKARSRSSSPPGAEGDEFESRIESETAGSAGTQSTSTLTQASAPTAAKPLGREELDNTTVGEDGMTDYQREHQHDEWAENLDWPVPQTYVEAGVVSSYIEDLVRKNWTERDTREAIEFWDREFREGLKAAHEAEAQGRVLEWVTDPDEILELEKAVAAGGADHQ